MSEELEPNNTSKTNHWQNHIAAWEASELSAAAYCRANDINQDKFKYWQYKLAPHTKSTNSKTKTSPSEFIELKPIPEQATIAPRSYFELKTNHGLSITLNGVLDNEKLKKLMMTIKELL